MKKLLLSLILVTADQLKADMQPLILEAEILEIVDGFPLGIDANKVGSIMRLRLDINKRRFGKTSAGIVGFYHFEDKKYTLQELIDLEDQLLRSNSATDQKRLQSLYASLEEMKVEFMELVNPMLLDARGAKSQMVILIGEWSQKARRANSLLLDWANTKEGDETSSNNSVYKKILTIRAFDQFCNDLVYFLETLLRSCPKACAQFKIMMEQKQQQK